MKKPIASILVPLHNAEQYVSQTLRSILSQDSTPIEVVVIDDHSLDGSRELVAAYGDPRIRLLSSQGRGIATTLNHGIEAAVGSVIMRCDADDLYPINRIKAQLDWLAQNPEFDAVCGSFSTIDKRGKLISRMPTGDSRIEITDELRAGKSRTHLCTFAMRSDAVRKLDGFRSYFETAEDLDFQFRLAAVARVAYVPEDWYHYRIHQSSITHVQANSRREHFEKMAREFATQRRDGREDMLQLGLAPTAPELGARSDNYRSSSHMQGLLLSRAWAEFGRGQSMQALGSAARAILADVSSTGTWRSVLAMIWRTIFKSSSNG